MLKKPFFKRAFYAFLFLLIFFLTIRAVFSGQDLSELLLYLKEADPFYIGSAIVLILFFIISESVIIFYMMHALNTKVSFLHCCLYSFIGFFYSAITPSASGGQPMQVLAMHRDQISPAVSAVVLAIVTITYKLVLVLIGSGVLLFHPASILECLEPVLGIVLFGLSLNILCVAALFLIVFDPSLVRRISHKIFSLAGRIFPAYHPEKREEKLEHILNQYHGTAEFFRKSPGIILNVFLITLLQRMFLFFTAWCTYRAFGLRGSNPATLTLLYAMISVAADMLPLPGGMGISETLFLSIFPNIFHELLLPAMIVCRGISYYTQLLISAVMTGISFLVIRKKPSSDSDQA